MHSLSEQEARCDPTIGSQQLTSPLEDHFERDTAVPVSPEGTVGGERKSDATARRNAARNKKDAEVLAARDAKVVSVNPFFLEKELLVLPCSLLSP